MYVCSDILRDSPRPIKIIIVLKITKIIIV